MYDCNFFFYRVYYCCRDDNKIKMAMKPGKKMKENPVGCTGKG